MIHFQSLTRAELAALLLPLGRKKLRRDLSPEEAELKLAKQARYRAQQVFHWVYQRQVLDWGQMTDLSKDLRSWLQENVEIYQPIELQSQQATDGTMKFLWDLQDHKTVESVIIPAALQEKEPEAAGEASEPAKQRLTLCISSQVGCAMKCKFCLTGIQGLERHLQVHEIVGQVLELRRRAPITNIVFMGMGEPLHNFENVVKACEILLDQDGLNFSKRKVTVSTSGLVPAIEELGKRIDVSLAVSLNATTDEQRSEIMPVNKKWNIKALLDACRKYPLGSHRRITFEYVLLKDFNDSLEDAARLVRLVQGIPSKINLIPFNEHPGSTLKRPADDTVLNFQRYLLDRDVTALIRISRGQDILAACGQLRSVFKTG
ncbi:MAG TPA: 23S rRNA (adenine(2503)-C(2))-methyltransferase RlmN [Bdellovibrionales bacterium]|nr:23S rRNA (adenine(2503)-C(2))-methyltransferase RlmN [Bdellovibrionales bacterium]HCM40066.1 23S rRNA (adenine(2503)-C(2))-methyltransferase RlmN [Bdellovibrionales bacterium]